MKYYLSIAVALVVLYGLNAQAQQNWIRCEHLVTGETQMFPGSSCPAQWFPV